MSNNDNDQFCLRLEDFDNNVRATWQQLQNENDFCDVTLACDDKQIQTHKIIISSISTVFRNIIKLNSSQHPVIYLRGVRYEDLQNLLNFIYQGEVNIKEKDLKNFIAIAQDLKIRGLSENLDVIKGSVKNDGPSLPNKRKLGGNHINAAEALKMEDNDIKEIESLELEENDLKVTESLEIKANDIKETESLDLKEDTTEPSYFEEHFDNPLQNYQKSFKKTKIEQPEQSLVSYKEKNAFSCEKCDKQLTTQTGLYYHNQSIHEKVRYSCEHCDYKATKTSHLKRHVEAKH